MEAFAYRASTVDTQVYVASIQRESEVPYNIMNYKDNEVCREMILVPKVRSLLGASSHLLVTRVQFILSDL